MVGTRRIVLTTASAEHCRLELDVLPGIQVVKRDDLTDDAAETTVAQAIEGAWAVIAGREKYGRKVLQGANSLRVIIRWGAGSDAIDIGAATDNGVAVVTTPGANAEAVADMALALMLAVVRRLPELDAAVRRGSWRPPWESRDLSGSAVGIIGLGAVGRAVARRLHAFGCGTIAVEPQPDRGFCVEHAIEIAELAEMLPRVDAVTLHAPLTSATRRILGAEELALLPRHAVIVNTSRGQLIDQRALVAALRAGALGGAALDVFETEPLPPDDPLTQLPNVVLTGHASAFTHLALNRTGQAVVAALRDLLQDRLPASCLNPDAWARERTVH